MRSFLGDELSVPQFRILAHIFRGVQQASELAKSHGVSQAAMSKMVDGLVDKKLVRRETDEKDRRQIVLELTQAGEVFFKKTRAKAQEKLRLRLLHLDVADQEKLRAGLLVLKKVFTETKVSP
jgi:DNA-binding MarR family transcriptional regulator